ncbi:30S ribosomal protein S8 [Candidatus Pacearchaeota archaeon]|nr:30S ribosomal protein S8 [Candidatus Pacearchaeota archaeon]
MSQDIIADTLNQIMNRKKAGYADVVVNRYSNLLLELFEIVKKEGYIKDYKIIGNNLEIKFNLHYCKAIKPRYAVNVKVIDKYVRRFIPSRDFGIIVISTNKGLMTHKDALKNNLGGSLLAYFF